MASPTPAATDHQATLLLPTLADELLEEIFLRLPTLSALARASAACRSFHRIITARTFLRRFRAVHPPPLLGLFTHARYSDESFHPAEAPHPSASMASALAHAADFSYRFVPTGRWLMPWGPVDVRQGRVLLECLPQVIDVDKFSVRDLELAVCDPLYRRYVLLPPIPDELTAHYERLFDFGVLLAPTGEDEEETSFRVVCTASNRTLIAAFVFASVTGQWSLAASPTWSSLGTGPPHVSSICVALFDFGHFDFALGCFYWTGHWIDKMLVLDAARMEFSVVNKPSANNLKRNSGEPHVATTEKGSPCMLFISDHNEDVSGDLLNITSFNDSKSSDKWQLEKTIPLPRQDTYSTVCAEEGFLFLHRIPKKVQNLVSPWQEYAFREYFSLDVKTSQLMKVCRIKRRFSNVHAYFGFPPSLSKPSI